MKKLINEYSATLIIYVASAVAIYLVIDVFLSNKILDLLKIGIYH